MFRSLWRRFVRGRKPDRAANELLVEIAQQLQADVVHGDTLQARHKHPVTHVRIRPMLPVTDNDIGDGWCGGDPCLPKAVEWPQIDGTDAYFLCQVNCAALPDAIWQGAGPRQGWLIVFFGRQNVKVLYSQDQGELRPGPDQGDADWFRPWDRYRTHNRLPKWPVNVVTHHGSSEDSLRPPAASAKLGFGRAELAMKIDETVNFADHGQWPFDRTSLELMLDMIERDVSIWARRAESLLSDRMAGKLTDEDAEFVLQYAEKIGPVAEQFQSIKADADAQIQADHDVSKTIAQVMLALQSFSLSRCQKQRDGAPYYSETTPILEKPENFLGLGGGRTFFVRSTITPGTFIPKIPTCCQPPVGTGSRRFGPRKQRFQLEGWGT